MPLDKDTVAVLAAWRKTQLEERLAWARPGLTATGSSPEDGTPIRPDWVSVRFHDLAARAGLPPIRFHDLRLGTATMLFAIGTRPKIISQILGHATVAFTMDVYTEVADALLNAAASLAAYIPRRNRPDHG